MIPSQTLAAMEQQLRNWPKELYSGDTLASERDCQLQKTEIEQLLKTDLSISERLFLDQFRVKLIIYIGQLRSDTLQCTLGECG